MKNVKALTVRFNLGKERDMRIWNHLHRNGIEKYNTCSNAVIEELHEYRRIMDNDECLKEMISDSIGKAIRNEFARILNQDEQEVRFTNYVEYDDRSDTKNNTDDSVFDSALFDG